MDTSALKSYAPKARQDFISAVTARAASYGLSASHIETMAKQGDVVLIGDKAHSSSIADKRKKLEERIERQGFAQFVEAMAYPEIDLPMYKPLADYSSELFLPNINFIEQNSISLLETNQEFIESYMVGLNHEFSRELMWREYPTDQRGSYFRQFWEAQGFHDTDNLSPEELKEKLRDIPPIHTWLKRSTS